MKKAGLNGALNGCWQNFKHKGLVPLVSLAAFISSCGTSKRSVNENRAKIEKNDHWVTATWNQHNGRMTVEKTKHNTKVLRQHGLADLANQDRINLADFNTEKEMIDEGVYPYNVKTGHLMPYFGKYSLAEAHLADTRKRFLATRGEDARRNAAVIQYNGKVIVDKHERRIDGKEVDESIDENKEIHARKIKHRHGEIHKLVIPVDKKVRHGAENLENLQSGSCPVLIRDQWKRSGHHTGYYGERDTTHFESDCVATQGDEVLRPDPVKRAPVVEETENPWERDVKPDYSERPVPRAQKDTVWDTTVRMRYIISKDIDLEAVYSNDVTKPAPAPVRRAKSDGEAPVEKNTEYVHIHTVGGVRRIEDNKKNKDVERRHGVKAMNGNADQRAADVEHGWLLLAGGKEPSYDVYKKALNERHIYAISDDKKKTKPKVNSQDDDVMEYPATLPPEATTKKMADGTTKVELTVANDSVANKIVAHAKEMNRKHHSDVKRARIFKGKKVHTVDVNGGK